MQEADSQSHHAEQDSDDNYIAHTVFLTRPRVPGHRRTGSSGQPDTQVPAAWPLFIKLAAIG